MWPHELAQKPASEIEEFFQYQRIVQREFDERTKKIKAESKRDRRRQGRRVIDRNR